MVTGLLKVINESQIEVVATVCSTQYIILNVHTVCDVIFARSCGTLPASAAIIFLLTLECMMQL